MITQLKCFLVAASFVLTAQIAFADRTIKAVQERLIEIGFKPGVADGIWGKNTENALREFLSKKGLIFDGILDENELELLQIQDLLDEKVKLKLNIHRSLPQSWVAEFNEILKTLKDVLPIDEKFNSYVKNSTLEIYAWSSKVSNPFTQKPNMSGACICGDGKTKWMVLEINHNEFRNNSLHRYSVIVHEYFHAYQIGLSRNRMQPKWLVEGSAKVLEEMFVQQYYGRSSLKKDFERRNPYLWSDDVFINPHLYEKHETSSKETSNGWMDMNYAGSAFMVLTLVNELKKTGISEAEALELILRNFWIEQSKQKNWKAAFKISFGMNVETFYEILSTYSKRDINKLLPSKSLKIQKIFY